MITLLLKTFVLEGSFSREMPRRRSASCYCCYVLLLLLLYDWERYVLGGAFFWVKAGRHFVMQLVIL